MRKTPYLVTALLLLLHGAAASKSITKGSELSIYLFVAIMAPFAASIVIAALYPYLKDLSAYLGALSAFISLVSVFQLYGSNFTASIEWMPSIGLNIGFYSDGLSLLMATLASGIGILVFIYSKHYMEHSDRKRKYYTVLTAFMGSMIGLVFSSNLFLLFLFWELTSVCSFLLISHNQRTSEAIYASRKSLLVTVGSGMMLLIGFLMVGETLGTYSLAQMLHNGNAIEILSQSGLFVPSLLLIFVGAAAKSAQIPLHIWLPDAMEAPTPVSAFLHSATMVKAGIFLLARIRPLFVSSDLWTWLLVSTGLLTMTGAALLAVRSSELKELLAYSTASHLGLIVAGLGFSSVIGAETGVFHILNHAVFKAALFMTAGIILHEAGTQKFSKLSGLRKSWPVLTVVASIAALGMAGIPPFNGFYSKELLFEASYHFATHSETLLSWIVPVISVLGSAFTLMYSFKFLSVFFGEEKTELPPISKGIILAPAVLAVVALGIGIVPNRFISILIEPALSSTALEAHGMSVHLPTSLKPSFVMTLITVFLGLLGFRNLSGVENSLNNILDKSPLTANSIYHGFLEKADRASDLLVKYTESRLLRTYIVWTLLSSVTLGLLGFMVSNAVPIPAFTLPPSIIIVLSTAVLSVYAVINADKYIAAVLTLSILGFMVSIYYLLMDAPDLVMTQLVVETLTLIIFLLVLDKLPEMKKHVTVTRKMKDILIAAATGFTVFTAVLYSKMVETPKELSHYYIENAVPGSGGTNVVNVILVDFRGIDTMGEISVIAMAGIAIIMLFKMRGENK